VRYDFTKHIGVRGEWQRYHDMGGGNVVKTDVDVLSTRTIRATALFFFFLLGSAAAAAEDAAPSGLRRATGPSKSFSATRTRGR
jgi:hypothetical protein